MVGLINTPTARTFDESTYGLTFYDGDPDKKLTFTASPYNWLEAAVFYTKIEGKPYGGGFDQSYVDKGFNIKIKLKEEGRFPALAIGINDLAGTGYYGSEYIVASYGISNLDIHFGYATGALNNSDYKFKNPLGYLYDGFNERSDDWALREEQDFYGGSLEFSRYFSDEKVSPLFGITYLINNKTLLKIEHDPTLTPGKVGYEESNSQFSYGLDFLLTKNFSIGLSKERDNHISLRLIYKNIPDNRNKYKRIEKKRSSSKITNFRRSIENNGIGVNKIIKNADKLGIEITQFAFSNSDVIEEIIMAAKQENNIDEDLVINKKIVNLDAEKNFDDSFESVGELLYERKNKTGFNTNTKFVIRPFLAAREGFLKGAVLLENNSEYVIKDNLLFTSNMKYSIWNNFDDLVVPPIDTYPAQVRSDVKDYLNNFNDQIIIGRAQFDGFKTISPNNHLMFSAGIFEEMFSGYGMEYLHFKNESNHAYGFELFKVYKRDYELQFGLLDYEQVTGHFNYYYRNYGLIPFDLKASYGIYLAGDKGGTIELSRTYSNGVSFGVFATFTDVTSEQFGEGSFDKGIFFNIPIFANMINYTWRPLTKDPGAKLARKNNLHDLLVKFRPIN